MRIQIVFVLLLLFSISLSTRMGESDQVYVNIPGYKVNFYSGNIKSMQVILPFLIRTYIISSFLPKIIHQEILSWFGFLVTPESPPCWPATMRTAHLSWNMDKELLASMSLPGIRRPTYFSWNCLLELASPTELGIWSRMCLWQMHWMQYKYSWKETQSIMGMSGT